LEGRVKGDNLVADNLRAFYTKVIKNSSNPFGDARQRSARHAARSGMHAGYGCLRVHILQKGTQVLFRGFRTNPQPLD
jgi:hypothetical protein